MAIIRESGWMLYGHHVRVIERDAEGATRRMQIVEVRETAQGNVEVVVDATPAMQPDEATTAALRWLRALLSNMNPVPGSTHDLMRNALQALVSRLIGPPAQIKVHNVEAPPAPQPDPSAPQHAGLLMRYFVLKPGATGWHGRACREAMRAYADVCSADMPQLAKELVDWADAEAARLGEKL